MALQGHDIFWYVEDRKAKNLLKNLPITQVDNWQRYVNLVDMIIFDSTGYGQLQDELRQKGRVVIGGSSAEKLETDRNYGASIAREFGLTIPEEQTFKDAKSVAQFVESNPDTYVLKASGENLPPYSSFVGSASDGSDVVAFADFLESKHGKHIKEFVLCSKLHGIEVGVAAYFAGDRFLMPFSINFEHKRLGTGHPYYAPQGTGQNTGELGTSMFNTSEITRFTQMLIRFEKFFAHFNHFGIIDINTITTRDTSYFLEWTVRFGYPSTMIEQALAQSGHVDDFNAIAQRQNLAWELNKWAVGVVGASIGYPYEDEYKKSGMGMPFIGVKTEDILNAAIFPWEVEADEHGNLYTSDGNGSSVVANGASVRVDLAITKAYINLLRVKLPSMYFRTDIGKNSGRDYSLLRDWQWL